MALYTEQEEEKKPSNNKRVLMSDLFNNVETTEQKQQNANVVKYLTEEPLSFAEQRVRSTDNLLKEIPSVKDLAVADYLTKSEMSGAEKLVRQKDNQVPSDRNVISVAGRKVDLNPASPLDKILDTIGFSKESFGQGLISGATLGVTDRLSPKTEPEQNPYSNMAGQLVGSALPWGLASKAVGGISTLSKVANPIAQTAVREGIAGGVIGATEGAIKGESLPDIAKTSGGYALGGALIGGGLKTAGALKGAVYEGGLKDLGKGNFKDFGNKFTNALTPTPPTTTSTPQSILNDVPSVTEVVTGRVKPVEAKSLQGTFKLQNTGLKNATAEYENAIQKIQNEFKTSQLRTSEQAQIQSRLGLNVDDLVNNMAKYEGPQLKNITEASKLKTASGLRGEKVYNVLENVKKSPKTETPNIGTMTKAEFDAKYGIDKDLRGLSPEDATKAQRESVSKLLNDSGTRIINKVGGDDYKEVAKYYVNKYNLPKEIKIRTLPMKESKPAQIKINYDNTTGKIKDVSISINSKTPKEQAIGAMRHEIEHYIDEVNGYKSIAKSAVKLDPNSPKTTRGIYDQYAKGHHKNYGWFEADYLYKAMQKDANKIPKTQTTTVVRPNEVTMTPNNPRVTVSEPIQHAEAILGTGGNLRERGLARNLRTDLNSPESLRNNLNNPLMTYEVQSEKEVLSKAEKIFSEGYEAAKSKLYSTIDNHKNTENVPLAVMLARESAKRGDITTARTIVADMADRLTDAGRLSNAAKLLRKSDPTSAVMYLERRIAKINAEGKKIYGSKWKDVKVSDDTTSRIMKLEMFDEQGLNRELDRATQEIVDQLPASNLEKLNALRRTAMLLNPTTMIRNVVGNGIMQGLRKGSDKLAAGIEKGLNIPKESRLKSTGWRKDPELVNVVNENFDKVKMDLEHGGRWDIDSLTVGNQEKKIFDNKVLEGVNRFTADSLNKPDNWFMEKAFKDSLGQYLKARGTKEVTQEALDYAKIRAWKATFKDTDMVIEFINKTKRKNPVANIAMGSVMPFVKTPINVLKRGFEYSPLNIIANADDFVKLLFKKETKKTPGEVIENIAQGMTGTAVTGLGLLLASMGWARTKSKSKSYEALKESEGNQSFSLNTPLGSYTLDWAQPTSMPFFMGVAIQESLAKKNPDLLETVVESIGSAGDTVLGMSVFRNIMQVIKSQSPIAEVAKLPVSYLESFFPAIVGKAARTIDDTRRITYGQTDTEALANRVKSKTPWASTGLEPKVNVFGQEMKNEGIGGDNVIGRLISQTISPGYYNQNQSSPLTKELDRLVKTLNQTDFLPGMVSTSSKEKSPQQVTAMQKELGQKNLKDLTSLVNSYEYRKSSDADKAKLVNKVTSKNARVINDKYR